MTYSIPCGYFCQDWHYSFGVLVWTDTHTLILTHTETDRQRVISEPERSQYILSMKWLSVKIHLPTLVFQPCYLKQYIFLFGLIKSPKAKFWMQPRYRYLPCFFTFLCLLWKTVCHCGGWRLYIEMQENSAFKTRTLFQKFAFRLVFFSCYN